MSHLTKSIMGGLIFVGLSLALLFPSLVSAKTYTDLPSYHKNSVAVQALTGEGIVKGYPDGRFQPEGEINRAEAVKVLIGSRFNQSAIGSSLLPHQKNGHRFVRFPDVGLGEWFAPYVELSYQHGVVKGYPDGTFKPGSSINFAEALKVILESHEVDLSRTRYRPSELILMKQGEWFQPYFSYAYDKNLINRDKFYHPGQLISRGEFVEILYRLRTLQASGGEEYKQIRKPTSNEYTISIPSLNIVSLKVSFADIYNEKGALNVLTEGMGHYLSPPDAKRKMVLFGHSSGYSWDNSNYKTILRQIDKLRTGDKIYINYKEKGYVYEIFKSEIIPASQDYKLLSDQKTNELALYTCWPPNSISHRYVVYGKPLS